MKSTVRTINRLEILMGELGKDGWTIAVTRDANKARQALCSRYSELTGKPLPYTLLTEGEILKGANELSGKYRSLWHYHETQKQAARKRIAAKMQKLLDAEENKGKYIVTPNPGPIATWVQEVKHAS